MGQENLKFLTETLRKRLRDVPGFADIMDDYSEALTALENLGKEGARANNAAVIGMIEAGFLGAGAMAGMPAVATGVALARRIALAPRVSTAVGSAIAKSTPSTIGIMSRGAGASMVNEIQ
jgi:hypothetical protein